MTSLRLRRSVPFIADPTRVVSALASGFALAIAACSASPPARQPNIVLIVADDLGWKDLGSTGAEFYETPRLDELAGAGMRFDAAYAAASNCLPSRASLLSGQYSPRHRVFADRAVDRGAFRQMRLRETQGASDLAADATTIAEALRPVGYATAMFGKWQVGRKPEVLPGAQGFDVSRQVGPRGSESDPKGIFSITGAAREFMRQNRERPFFLYVAHNAVHSPLRSRAETLARFEAKQPRGVGYDPAYAANVYDLDAGVGELLDELDALDLARDTLVVFTSDNGAGAASPQAPLRGVKGTYYEGGLRVPLLARWPGVIEPGSRSEVPVIGVDLYPTFLAAAGAAVPAALLLDGESLLPLFRGGSSLEREALFWHFPAYLRGRAPGARDEVFRSRPISVIRKGDWKLHLHHEEWTLDGGRAKVPGNGALELYDLARDPGERSDLAATHPDERDELLAVLEAWLEQSGLGPMQEARPYGQRAPRPPGT